MDKYMPLTESISDQLDLLDVSGEGELVRGLRRYFFKNELPNFDDRLLQMVFTGCKRKLDENRQHAEEISAIRSEAGKRGGAPVGNQNARTSKTSKSLSETSNIDRDGNPYGYRNKDGYPYGDEQSEQTKNSSNPPSAPLPDGGAEGMPQNTTPADVAAYFVKSGSSEAAAFDFISYYDQLGWRYKGSGNPIKHWKSAAASWIRKSKDGTASTPIVVDTSPDNDREATEELRRQMLEKKYGQNTAMKKRIIE